MCRQCDGGVRIIRADDVKGYFVSKEGLDRHDIPDQSSRMLAFLNHIGRRGKENTKVSPFGQELGARNRLWSELAAFKLESQLQWQIGVLNEVNKVVVTSYDDLTIGEPSNRDVSRPIHKVAILPHRRANP